MDNNFEELSRYFSIKEWNSLTEYEKQRNFNIMRNYKAMMSFGLNPRKPDFMCCGGNLEEDEKAVSPGRKRHESMGDDDLDLLLSSGGRSRKRRSRSSRNGVSKSLKYSPSPRKSITIKFEKIRTRSTCKKEEANLEGEFFGFCEEDNNGTVGALKALKKSIQKLEKEPSNSNQERGIKIVEVKIIRR